MTKTRPDGYPIRPEYGVLEFIRYPHTLMYIKIYFQLIPLKKIPRYRPPKKVPKKPPDKRNLEKNSRKKRVLLKECRKNLSSSTIFVFLSIGSTRRSHTHQKMFNVRPTIPPALNYEKLVSGEFFSPFFPETFSDVFFPRFFFRGIFFPRSFRRIFFRDFSICRAKKKNMCVAGRTVKVKTCCEALTFDKVGREKGLK